MIDRVIEVGEAGGSLSCDLDRLAIERDGVTLATIPLREIAALILAHPRIRISHPTLDGISRAGGIVVICDARRMPSGMLLPLQAFGLPSQRMRLQWAMTEPRRKRIWRRVIQAKIRAQAAVVDDLGDDSGSLQRLVPTVRSGDTTNVEATAARRYWQALFGPGFRRLPEGGPPNPALNYGYAVLRALVTRTICGAGLHPCVGIHHHSRSNPFCLADDLMEPFRPIVDRTVIRLFGRDPDDMPPTTELLDQKARSMLIAALLERHVVNDERRTLPDLIRRTVSNVVRAMEHGSRDLEIAIVP